MKITKKELKKLIKEFKISPEYADIFDFESGGGDLPPVEPPDNSGGGRGSGSNYPQRLIDRLVNGGMFTSDASMGSPESCTFEMNGGDITVSGDNQGSTVFIMFSFLRFDLGYTDIVDHMSFNCASQQTVNDLFSGISRLGNALSTKTTAALNRELSKEGHEFITRYMLNPNPGSRS